MKAARIGVMTMGLAVSCILLMLTASYPWAQSEAPTKAPDAVAGPAAAPTGAAAPATAPAASPAKETKPAAATPPAGPGKPPESPPATASLPFVTAESMLVIYSPKEKFATPAYANEVIFKSPKGDLSKRAQFVSPDSGAIVVQVPEGAQPDVVTVKIPENKVVKVTMTAARPGEDSSGTKIFYGVMALLPMLLFIGFLYQLNARLKESTTANKWNLGGALSEVIDQKKGLIKEGNNVKVNDKTGEPLYELESKPLSSSSRLIAFIGLFAIITWIIALLLPATYYFYSTGQVPDLGKASTFLAAQAAIFAPYIVGKVVSAFTNK